nr:MAG TPA: rbx1 RING-H2 zinc finger domain [Caudoviricetes sp.]
MIIPLNAEYRSLRYQYTTRCAICQEVILKISAYRETT